MSILEKVLDVVTPATKNTADVDAVALLKQDHDDVDKLLKEYEELVDGDTAGPDRRALSTRICGLLAVHAIIEEEIFYPAARAAAVDAALLNEATIEHGSVKELIAHIGESQVSDELYDARVKVLGEYVRHHVKEEESELFPACRKAKMDLDGLGQQLRKRQEELMHLLGGGDASA